VRDERPNRSPTAERILQEAARLFTTRGFGTTSTRDIAFAVGITQPGLYRHYASKDEILAALFERATAHPIAVAQALTKVTAADATRLYRFLYEAADHLVEAPLVLAAVVHTSELQLPVFAPQAAALSQLAKLTQAMIEGGIQSRDFRDVNPRSTTLMIFEATNVFANPITIASARDDLLDFVFSSLLRKRNAMKRLRDVSLKLQLDGTDPTSITVS
jgi:AcrR family transcriptional regulator